MSNTSIMEVLDTKQELQEDNLGLRLAELFLFNQPVKEISTLHAKFEDR